MTKAMLVVVVLVAGLLTAAQASSTPCTVGPPLYQTTHMNPSAEVPLPTSGVVVLGGHSNATAINRSLQAMLPVPTLHGGIASHDSALWADANEDEYATINQRLAAIGKTPSDVTGWVWVSIQRKTNNAAEANAPGLVTNFEGDMNHILDRLEVLYPNLQTVWIASPVASFSPATNAEPSPYRQGAATIEHTGRIRVIPGPYLWTDQTCSRTDGLAVAASDYLPDGVHPNPETGAGPRFAAAIADFLMHPAPPVTTTTTAAPTTVITQPTTTETTTETTETTTATVPETTTTQVCG